MSQQHQQLNQETWNRMVAALQTINRLSTKAIKEKSDAAEFSAAGSFLMDNLQQHAGELLGAWNMVANEYQPIVRAYAQLNLRAREVAAEWETRLQGEATARSAQEAPQADGPAPAADKSVEATQSGLCAPSNIIKI